MTSETFVVIDPSLLSAARVTRVGLLSNGKALKDITGVFEPMAC